MTAVGCWFLITFAVCGLVNYSIIIGSTFVTMLWLDEHFPLRAVTVTTREPESVTPEIKHLLRRKNRLMRSNREEEPSAVAERIRKAIIKANRKELNDLDPRHGTQNLWHRVNKLIHKPRGQDQTSQVSAEDLNTHYAAISTDPAYVAPPLRHTAQSSPKCLYLTC